MHFPGSPLVLFFSQPSSLDPRPARRRRYATRPRELGGVRQRARSAGLANPVRPSTSQILDMLTEIQAAAMSKMQVHPAILMKTKNSRFQVSGTRCQDQRDRDFLPRAE